MTSLNIFYSLAIILFVFCFILSYPYCFTCWTGGIFSLLIANEIRNSQRK